MRSRNPIGRATCGRQTNFFVGFPQRGLHSGNIIFFGGTAGKTDLSGVLREVLGTTGRIPFQVPAGPVEERERLPFCWVGMRFSPGGR